MNQPIGSTTGEWPTEWGMQHQHSYTVVVEWEYFNEIKDGKTVCYTEYPFPTYQKAKKVMCECGEIKDL